ncbi:hypothetical protein M5E87_28115 [Flavonifractor plautii]|nr:hypothetical protein M5E87_28115 [Flavonifractor plautii]
MICQGCADALREFTLYCWDEKAGGDRVKSPRPRHGRHPLFCRQCCGGRAGVRWRPVCGAGRF